MIIKNWFQTANFGWSNVSNTKKNSKERKTQNSQFSENDRFLRGHGVRRGSCVQKIFLPKFVQRSVLRICEVWGVSEKPFFGNLNSKPRGGKKSKNYIHRNSLILSLTFFIGVKNFGQLKISDAKNFGQFKFRHSPLSEN